MALVSGLLRVGEATPTVRSISARQRGSTIFYYAVLYGMMAGGAVCGHLFALYVTHSDVDFATIAGGVAGAVGYLLICQRLTLALFRRRMEKKGHPPLMQLEMEITPERLIYIVADVEHRAPWHAVSELFEKRGYWIFLVQSSPFFAPKRFFESPAAEKAFVHAALEQMSEEARDRSRDAVAFANET